MLTLETRFLGLLRENRQRILRVCRVYAWGAQDREDLYQEMLFQIWRGLPGLKEEAHANTWLYRIALNTAISFVRKSTAASRRAVAGTPDRVPESIEQPPGPAPDPRVDSLYQAISQLDKVEKAIITLFLEEMSYQEIGVVMGLNVSHVGVMLHRAKKKIFLLMNEEVTT